MQAYSTFSVTMQGLIRGAVADAVIVINSMSHNKEGSDRLDPLSFKSIEKQAGVELWQQLDPNSDSSEEQMITKLMREAIRDVICARVQFVCR